MNKKYIIHWKSKVNGRAGKGTKLFDADEADQLARELNLEYPQIHHEAVSVDREPISAAIEPDLQLAVG